MGNEFAQTSEWNHHSELDWFLLKHDSHKLMQSCVKDLNHLYTAEPALYELQFETGGFEWINLNHRQEGVIVYKRKGLSKEQDILVVLNVTPVVRRDWKLQVYGKSSWTEIFNSNEKKYWGSGDVFNPTVNCLLLDAETGLYELTIHLPALGGLVFR
jgi:1,4-alpha-glucan branching enzyme